MSVSMMRQAGVDVPGIESNVLRSNSLSALPCLDRRARTPSAGPGRRSPNGSQTPPAGLRRSQSGAAWSRPGSRSGSRPGSSSGCVRPKANFGLMHPQEWVQLGRVGVQEAARPGSILACKNQLGVHERAPEPPSSLERIPAVLFLDVDGVLHPVTIQHPRQQFAKNCMTLLKEVLSRTDATIVLSTAWREDSNARRILAEKLWEHGLPAFVSQTPSIARFRRSREILAWVRKYRPLTWVAVDDLPLLGESQDMQDHFVQTHPHFGLRQNGADKIVELFQLQQRCLEKKATDVAD